MTHKKSLSLGRRVLFSGLLAGLLVTVLVGVLAYPQWKLHRELHALMYRVRNAHLDYLYKDGELNFSFEPDVVINHALVISRLRALLLQEALEKVQICF